MFQLSSKTSIYLWAELYCFPDQLHLLSPVILLHNGDAKAEVSHPRLSLEKREENTVKTSQATKTWKENHFYGI